MKHGNFRPGSANYQPRQHGSKHVQGDIELAAEVLQLVYGQPRALSNWPYQI